MSNKKSYQSSQFLNRPRILTAIITIIILFSIIKLSILLKQYISTYWSYPNMYLTFWIAPSYCELFDSLTILFFAVILYYKPSFLFRNLLIFICIFNSPLIIISDYINIYNNGNPSNNEIEIMLLESISWAILNFIVFSLPIFFLFSPSIKKYLEFLKHHTE